MLRSINILHGISFKTTVEECDKIVRPLDDNCIDFWEKGYYSQVRQFAPVFLETFVFRSNDTDDSLLKALNLLRKLNSEKRRKIPEDAPIDFIPVKWKPYIFTNNSLNRHFYELCALHELRNSVRSGDIWVESSRRFANPESYLIPKGPLAFNLF